MYREILNLALDNTQCMIFLEIKTNQSKRNLFCHESR